MHANGNCRASVDRRSIIENYDLVSLAIDEIVDAGIILETDPTIVVSSLSEYSVPEVIAKTRLAGPASLQSANPRYQPRPNRSIRAGRKQLGTVRKGKVDRLASTRTMRRVDHIDLECVVDWARRWSKAFVGPLMGSHHTEPLFLIYSSLMIL